MGGPEGRALGGGLESVLARGRSLEAGSRWGSRGWGSERALPLAASAGRSFWVHLLPAHLGALVCLKCYDKRFILWGSILPVKWKGTGMSSNAWARVRPPGTQGGGEQPPLRLRGGGTPRGGRLTLQRSLEGGDWDQFEGEEMGKGSNGATLAWLCAWARV